MDPGCALVSWLLRVLGQRMRVPGRRKRVPSDSLRREVRIAQSRSSALSCRLRRRGVRASHHNGREERNQKQRSRDEDGARSPTSRRDLETRIVGRRERPLVD